MFRASSGFRLVSSFLVATFFGLGSFAVAQDANRGRRWRVAGEISAGTISGFLILAREYGHDLVRLGGVL